MLEAGIQRSVCSLKSFELQAELRFGFAVTKHNELCFQQNSAWHKLEEI